MPYQPPWWYRTFRAARVGNIPFDRAIRVPFNPLVQEWLLLGEAAESEAQEALIKQAHS